jgi:hypothetical protein
MKPEYRPEIKCGAWSTAILENRLAMLEDADLRDRKPSAGRTAEIRAIRKGLANRPDAKATAKAPLPATHATPPNNWPVRPW